MKHSFLDQYSDRDSLIHRLDPRTKLIAVFLFILAVSLTSQVLWPVFSLYFVLIAVLVTLSTVPVFYIFKRSLVIIPFVLLVAIFIPFFKEGEPIATFHIWTWQVSASYFGLQLFITILVKAWLSILSLIVLTSTTTISDLLHGMEQLRLPRVMVMIFSFMYRYIFVLTDEVMRMRQARDSRNVGGSRLRHVKTVGAMAGTLFIRSYERGERVYAAMLSRGYDGHTRTLRRRDFRLADLIFSICIVLVLAAACLFNYLH